MKEKPRLIWITRGGKLAMASYRLRCLSPSIYLGDLGWESHILTEDKEIESFSPKRYDILIIIKDLAPNRLAIARRFKEFGLPVIYDLCDPIFYEDYRGGRDVAGAKHLQEMLTLANLITTSSPGIAEGLKNIFHYSKTIPILKDAALKPIHIKRLMNWLAASGADLGPRIFPAYPQLKRSTIFFNVLRRRLLTRNFTKLHPGRRRVVWFGKSGGEYEGHNNISIGFRALMKWKKELIELNRKVPIELAIMSNSSLKNFRQYFGDWPFPVVYAEWSMLGFQKLMQSADLALVPVGEDQIAQCSSGNRITQSLALRVPVICNPLQGLEPLYPFLGLKGVVECGVGYLTDTKLRQYHLDGARETLMRQYSPQSVARSWDQILTELMQDPAATSCANGAKIS